MPFPKIEGYVVTEKLGSGSYSTVYKAYTKVGARTSVAIKCVDKSRVKHSGSAVDNLITEIRLLKTLVHPHIVHMHNFTWDDRNIYIITEYCSGGDLSKYIHRYGRVPETKVLYFLQQLASALKFLREKGVVHMDLKPHNLLLHKGSDGRYILKVADFGFAGHLSLDSPRSVRGSPLYMAPEMLAGRYDDRVDLWSVGVIMYECLFGKAPYSSSTFKELVDKIHKQAPIEIPPNSCITPGCRELLLRLLQHDPDARISYEEFFANEYLDLEHMPSKENYEKAVSLLQRAVQEARPACALRSYRAGLRLLLPAASAEPDAARRQALTAKLTKYMERAEAIQEYLRATEGREGQAGLGGQGLGGEGRGGLHDNDDEGPVVEPGPLSGPPQASADNCPSDRGIADSNVEPLPAAPDCPQGGARPKFGLKRFFSKNPPPSLDIDSDPQPHKSGKMGEPQNDACRIT